MCFNDRLGRTALSDGNSAASAAAWLQPAVLPCGSIPALPVAAGSLSRQLHASSAIFEGKSAGGVPALGGMPASKLKDTGAGAPHIHSDRCQ